MNWENEKFKIETNYTKSFSQVSYRMKNFGKLPRKELTAEHCFKVKPFCNSTIRNIIISSTNVFLKMFQNFQNSYFYVTPLDNYY